MSKGFHAILYVGGCTEAIFRYALGYGKSPCFSRLAFHESADIVYGSEMSTFFPWRFSHD